MQHWKFRDQKHEFKISHNLLLQFKKMYLVQGDTIITGIDFALVRNNHSHSTRIPLVWPRPPQLKKSCDLVYHIWHVWCETTTHYNL